MSATNNNRTKTQNLIKIAKNIRSKLKEWDALKIKSDKANTSDIINKTENDMKVKQFIKKNNISQMNTNPTKECKKFINKLIVELKTSYSQ